MISVISYLYSTDANFENRKYLGSLTVWNVFSNDGKEIPTSRGRYKWSPNRDIMAKYAAWCWEREGTWVWDNDWNLNLYQEGVVMTQWSSTMQLEKYFSDFTSRGVYRPSKKGSGWIYDGLFDSAAGYSAVTPITFGENCFGDWYTLEWSVQSFICP
jgi:hypothetical protein